MAQYCLINFIPNAPVILTRIDATRRYPCARLVCSYMLTLIVTRAVVTSREIALFHNLSGKSSQSISAMLNFLYTNHIRHPRFGFSILGPRPYQKCDYPHRSTKERINGARGSSDMAPVLYFSRPSSGRENGWSFVPVAGFLPCRVAP
jgi:hypothetical protein